MPARLCATDEDFIPILTVDCVSPGMRVLALIVVAGLVRTADADDEIVLPRRATGLLAEMNDVTTGPGTPESYGLTARAVLGHCRFGLLAETGGGVVLDTNDAFAGVDGVARLGGRLLVARFQDNNPMTVDLALDAGIGGHVYWLDHVVADPEAFFGWTVTGHGHHTGVEVSLRIAASPRDEQLTTIICRGTCSASGRAVGITIGLLLGVMTW
jgi:hypothetical protein